MKERKIPMRTCVVTREKYPKRELIRVVVFNGVVSIDASGKASGRGCYLKKDREVIETARKKNILSKVLEVQVEDKIYDELLTMITE